jgi:hypothetical protein
MRIIVILLLSALFSSCKKNSPSSESYKCTIQCGEQSVEPEFRNYTDSMLDTVVYKLYAPNGKFDSLIKEVTYYDKATVESHYYLNSKYDYEVIVVGVDTFRIWGFVNRPKSEEMMCGRRGTYGMHCYYYQDMIMIDKDTVHPSIGQYVSTIALFKK